MSGDGRERRVAGAVRGIRAPGERAALDRAVALAAETAAGTPARRALRRRRAALPAAVAVAAAAVLALTPAGAAVRDWIDDAVGPPPPTRTTLGPIPGGGELLVQSRSGPWVVRDDGSRRLLGDYDAAAWSPRGRYLAVTDGRTLGAVEPDGDPRWSIDAPGEARDPRWSTSGQRIAYRSAGDLRIVAGDGTTDRAIGPVAPHVAPAWMPVAAGPYSRNVLAYADTPESLRVIDADTGRVISHADLPDVSSIQWLGRDLLLAAGPGSLEIVKARSGKFDPLTLPALDGGRLVGVTASANGRSLAALTERNEGSGPPRATLTLARLATAGHRIVDRRRLFTGLGSFQAPQFSPDGSRVLLGWRDADQWLFFDAAGERRGGKPLAIGDVARQFDPGASRGEAAFPRASGWCCP
jgi:hypothetical protein